MHIIDAIKDDQLFRPFLGGELDSWKPWMQCLRAVYGLPVTSGKGTALIRQVTGRDADKLNPEGYVQSLFLTGRRSGKSRIAAVTGAYEAALSGREKKLAKGEREQAVQTKLRALQEKIGNLPSSTTLREVAEAVSSRFRTSPILIAKKKLANHNFEDMTWDEKRALAERVFSGKTEDGKRMGVYIEWIDGQEQRRRKRWKYQVRGHLIHVEGQVPMSASRQDAMFGLGAAHLQDDLVTYDALCSRAPARSARRFGRRGVRRRRGSRQCPGAGAHSSRVLG